MNKNNTTKIITMTNTCHYRTWSTGAGTKNWKAIDLQEWTTPIKLV